MQSSDSLDLLSVTQAAELLGIPPRTLHHRISTGKVRATKVGDGVTSAYVLTRAEVEKQLGEAQATA
jgi:excisionase family DNA binding protein